MAKTKKDDDKPKRPPNGYQLWLAEHREEIYEEIGSKKVGDVSKAAGARWTAMTEEDKEPWLKEAAQLREDAGLDPVGTKKKKAPAKKAPSKKKAAESEEEGSDDSGSEEEVPVKKAKSKKK